jgi:hypothetical protein
MVVIMCEMTMDKIKVIREMLASGKRVWVELNDNRVYEVVFAKGIKIEVKKRGASTLLYIGEKIYNCWVG